MTLDPRRLIKFGNSSFIVSLPKEWIERNGLKKGDIVYLEEDQNDLRLKVKDRERLPKVKKIVIDISKQDLNEIRREINSAYVNNSNFFVITGNNPKIKIEDVKKIFENLVGLEIIDQSNNEMLVRDFLDIETISPKKIVRRIDNVIRSMFEDIKLIKGNLKPSQLREIMEADKNINKLYFLVSRVVKKGFMDPSIMPLLEMNYDELSSTHWLVMNMEYIGDDLKRLARYISDYDLSDSQKKALSSLLANIEEAYISSMSAYYVNNKQSARLCLNKRQMLLKQCEALGRGSKEVLIGQIIEKFKSICIYVINIGRLVVY